MQFPKSTFTIHLDRQSKRCPPYRLRYYNFRDTFVRTVKHTFHLQIETVLKKLEDFKLQLSHAEEELYKLSDRSERRCDVRGIF